jgi:hypothetical protein
MDDVVMVDDIAVVVHLNEIFLFELNKLILVYVIIIFLNMDLFE